MMKYMKYEMWKYVFLPTYPMFFFYLDVTANQHVFKNGLIVVNISPQTRMLLQLGQCRISLRLQSPWPQNPRSAFTRGAAFLHWLRLFHNHRSVCHTHTHTHTHTHVSRLADYWLRAWQEDRHRCDDSRDTKAKALSVYLVSSCSVNIKGNKSREALCVLSFSVVTFKVQYVFLLRNI